MMELPHNPPEGFEYWTDQFNTKFTRIWIKNVTREFIYSDKPHPSSVWGFFNEKTGKYHSPINSKIKNPLKDTRECYISI